jgi:NAD(P)-dependent dehydrogenase (short-subunit alcohol dehydrogenase family)
MNEQPRPAGQSSVLIVGVGASRGLGAAIARRVAKDGHPVVIAGRNAVTDAGFPAKVRVFLEPLGRSAPPPGLRIAI